MNQLYSLVAPLALGLVVMAQGTAVFPGDHTNPMGSTPPYVNGSTYTASYPFSNGVSRTMYLYESWDLAIPDGAKINQVGFVRDGVVASTGKQVVLQVFAGGSNLKSTTANAQFDSNWIGGAGTEVYTRKSLSLPNLTSTGPNEVWVPLDTPYVFKAAENLVLDYRVFANSNGNASFLYYLDEATYLSPVVSVPNTGCPTSAGSIALLKSQPTAIGSSWQLTLSKAPATSPVLLGVGGALQTPSLPIPGAPGCDLAIQPALWLADQTDSSGSKYWSFPVPNNPWIYGKTLYTESYISDFFANALGVVASNTDQIKFGINPVCARIAATGNANATSGTVDASFGQLTLFAWTP